MRSLFALRPVAAVHRLPPRSQACPLSLRDILRGLAGRARGLPLFVAPVPAVARAALVAAQEARAVVGVALAAGAAPEPWFEALARAADELAPRLPFFASAEVVVEDGEEGLERAHAGAHRLVEAGVTHLAVDVAAVAPARRAQAAARVAGVAAERELAVECVIAPDALDPAAATAFLEEFEGWGVRADLVGLRCADAALPGEAQRQRGAMDALAGALDRPVLRRGGLGSGAAGAFRGGRLRLCEDGGAALAAGWRALPAVLRERGPGRGEQLLAASDAERIEALAYSEAAALIEALGAEGTAPELVAALGVRR
ncbi:hypothetical protein [Anaeromyxobacter diazotrophicus]|uniref:Uncharacterized protein n=1 Tax=Anaeromyxobacter diazotrophicus TaxID=2590199 RepID=A0A7I9VPU0_9BACT|nr:hypothetical protein [Anaeromyxobacter diazotrophicus]GEJ58436.1 hypothetical protein AMYX_31770 [Anaeromyxobacter diazotrophicus]